MLITIGQACKFYRVSKFVLEDWITVSWFPIVRVSGAETDVYDYKAQNWRVDSDRAEAWVDERVQRVVEGGTDALFIGDPDEPALRSKIIINQAEPEFLRDYLYSNMPDHVKVAVEKAEFNDLRRGFVSGHKRRRWFEAAGGILGHNALEALKREGDRLNTLVGLEARLYGLYIRSVERARSKRHPDFKTYVRGILGAGTFDHLKQDIVQQAKDKYGTEHVRGLEHGFSYWG